MKTLVHLTFATAHLHSTSEREIDDDIIQLISECLSHQGGRLGATGWRIMLSDENPPGVRQFTLSFQDKAIARAHMAWTQSASKPAWELACSDAEQMKQLRQATSRRKMRAPWLAAVLLPGIFEVPPTVMVEAEALECSVAWTVLKTMIIEEDS